jgi:starvation-inducible outer membrane lipoprotein
MKLILALSGAWLVAACSSLPTQSAENESTMVCDRVRMERIEAKAQATRTELHWVNCPLIRRDEAGSVS